MAVEPDAAQKALNKSIGKQIVTMEGETVTIETIVASLVKPTRFEINGKHHIVMLDFYKQLGDAKDITQDMIDKFDELEFHVEKVKKTQPKSLIEVQ